MESKCHLPGPAGNLPLTAAQDTVGLFAARIKDRIAHQELQVLPGWTDPACVGAWGCSLTGAGLCTPFCEHLKLPLSPFLPLVHVPLEGS